MCGQLESRSDRDYSIQPRNGKYHQKLVPPFSDGWFGEYLKPVIAEILNRLLRNFKPAIAVVPEIQSLRKYLQEYLCSCRWHSNTKMLIGSDTMLSVSVFMEFASTWRFQYYLLKRRESDVQRHADNFLIFPPFPRYRYVPSRLIGGFVYLLM